VPPGDGDLAAEVPLPAHVIRGAEEFSVWEAGRPDTIPLWVSP